MSFFRKSVNFMLTFHRRGRFKFTELVPNPIVYNILTIKYVQTNKIFILNTKSCSKKTVIKASVRIITFKEVNVKLLYSCTSQRNIILF